MSNANGKEWSSPAPAIGREAETTLQQSTVYAADVLNAEYKYRNRSIVCPGLCGGDVAFCIAAQLCDELCAEMCDAERTI